MKLKTCSRCSRILGMFSSESGANASSAMYCWDRPCYLYPALSKSRADDQTVAPYVLAVHDLTPVPDSELNKALGRNHGYAGELVRQHRLRWKSFT